MTNMEGFLMTAVFALLVYAMAVLGWTVELVSRWLRTRLRPPAAIANLVFGWPVYLASGFVWLVRRTRDTVTVQRLRVAVALAAAATVVCLLLYAPWVVGSGSSTRPCGRASVFGHGPHPGYNGWIATGELAVEVGAVLGVAGLLLVVIPKPR